MGLDDVDAASAPTDQQLLWATNEDQEGADLRCHSSELADATKRPRLEAVYVAP